MKGYKTIVFNVLMVAIAIAHALNPDAVLPSGDAVQGATDQTVVALSALWGVGNVILRAVTNSTIFKKTSPAPDPGQSQGGT